MSDIDKIIQKLFSSRWSGDLKHAHVCKMRDQLYKNLTDQVNGFWSGHTAYSIMIDGGFLVDSKRKRVDNSNKCEGKKLTEFGKAFVKDYESSGGKV